MKKINNIIVMLVSLKYFKNQENTNKPEIHSNMILQRHSSFKEATNFSLLIFMLDQLSNEFLGQDKNSK